MLSMKYQLFSLRQSKCWFGALCKRVSVSSCLSLCLSAKINLSLQAMVSGHDRLLNHDQVIFMFLAPLIPLKSHTPHIT